VFKVCSCVYSEKNGFLNLRKYKKKLKKNSALETYLKMLKIASYERKTLQEVEPLTFLSILTMI
jgi:hypothetical protein